MKKIIGYFMVFVAMCLSTTALGAPVTLELIMDFKIYQDYIPQNYSYELNYAYTSVSDDPFFDYEVDGVKVPITGLSCDAGKLCVGYASVDFNSESAIYATVNGVGDNNIRSSNSIEIMALNAAIKFEFNFNPVLTDPNGDYVVHFEDGVALAESVQPIYDGNSFSGGVVVAESGSGGADSLANQPEVKHSGSYIVTVGSNNEILGARYVSNSAPTITLSSASLSYVEGTLFTVDAIVADAENDPVVGCSWSVDGIPTQVTSCSAYTTPSALWAANHSINLTVRYKNVDDGDKETSITSNIAINVLSKPVMSIPINQQSFSATEGDNNLLSKEVCIGNIGNTAGMNWTVSNPSISWLTLSKNSGTDAIGNNCFTMFVNPNGLIAGSYISNLTIQSNDRNNSSGNITVTLTVEEAVPVVVNAMSIDLESDNQAYLSISDSLQKGLDITGDFTIEAYIKPETIGRTQYIVAKMNATTQYSYLFAILSSNVLVLQVSDNGTSSAGHFIDMRTNIPVITNVGVWYHVSVTYNAYTRVSMFYIDAVSKSSKSTGTIGANVFNSIAPFNIGRNPDGVSYFDGKIDEVRIWNIVRTPNEIYSNMNIDLNGVNEPNLQGCWKFEGTLIDCSKNNNTLVNYGGTFKTNP